MKCNFDFSKLDEFEVNEENMRAEEIREYGDLFAECADYELWQGEDGVYYKIYNEDDSVEELSPDEFSDEMDTIERESKNEYTSDYEMYKIYLEDDDDYVDMLGDFND